MEDVKAAVGMIAPTGLASETFSINDASSGTIKGAAVPEVMVTATENADGTLTITLRMLVNKTYGTISGLFMDAANEKLAPSLYFKMLSTDSKAAFATGDDTLGLKEMSGLTSTKDGDKSAGFDVSAAISSAAIDKDGYQNLSFIMGAKGSMLDLSFLNKSDIGVSFTSGLKLIENAATAYMAVADNVTALDGGHPAAGNMLSNDIISSKAAILEITRITTLDGRVMDQTVGNAFTVMAVNAKGELMKDVSALVTINKDGSYSIDTAGTKALALNETATIRIAYAATSTDKADGQAGSDSAVMTITLKGSNDGPTAFASSATALENTITTGALFASDPDHGAVLHLVSISTCPCCDDDGGQNNGWGNGDQTAPGNSDPHNNAENNSHGLTPPGNSDHGGATPGNSDHGADNDSCGCDIAWHSGQAIAIENAAGQTVAYITFNDDLTYVLDTTPGTDIMYNGDVVTKDFTFTVADEHGAQSSCSTITIAVIGAGERNAAPVAVDDEIMVIGRITRGNIADFAGNDTDPDGDPLSVTSINGIDVRLETLANLQAPLRIDLGHGGSLVIDSSGNYVFTAGLSESGFSPPPKDFVPTPVDAFIQYTVADPHGLTDVGMVSFLNLPNRAPELADVHVLVFEDEAKTFDLSSTARDPDAGDVLTFALENVGPAVIRDTDGNDTDILIDPELLASSISFSADGVLSVNAGDGAFDFLAEGMTALIDVGISVKDAAGAQAFTTDKVLIYGVDDPLTFDGGALSADEGAVTQATFAAVDLDLGETEEAFISDIAVGAALLGSESQAALRELQASLDQTKETAAEQTAYLQMIVDREQANVAAEEANLAQTLTNIDNYDAVYIQHLQETVALAQQGYDEWYNNVINNPDRDYDESPLRPKELNTLAAYAAALLAAQTALDAAVNEGVVHGDDYNQLVYYATVIDPTDGIATAPEAVQDARLALDAATANLNDAVAAFNEQINTLTGQIAAAQTVHFAAGDVITLASGATFTIDAHGNSILDATGATHLAQGEHAPLTDMLVTWTDAHGNLVSGTITADVIGINDAPTAGMVDSIATEGILTGNFNDILALATDPDNDHVLTIAAIAGHEVDLSTIVDTTKSTPPATDILHQYENLLNNAWGVLENSEGFFDQETMDSIKQFHAGFLDDVQTYERAFGPGFTSLSGQEQLNMINDTNLPHIINVIMIGKIMGYAAGTQLGGTEMKILDGFNHLDMGTTETIPGSLVLDINGGSLEIHPDGSYVLTMFADENGYMPHDFAPIGYTVMDEYGLTGDGTISIANNNRPDAVDDYVNSALGERTMFAVGGNDSDINNDSLAFHLASAALSGASLSAAGEDMFSYDSFGILRNVQNVFGGKLGGTYAKMIEFHSENLLAGRYTPGDGTVTDFLTDGRVITYNTPSDGIYPSYITTTYNESKLAGAINDALGRATHGAYDAESHTINDSFTYQASDSYNGADTATVHVAVAVSDEAIVYLEHTLVTMLENQSNIG